MEAAGEVPCVIGTGVFRVIFFAADVRVNGAADSQTAVEPGETNVAAQAAGNLINPAFLNLARPSLVGDKLAAHGNHVSPAVAEDFFGQIGIMLSGYNQGYLKFRFKMLGMFDKVIPILREEPFSGFIGTIGKVNVAGAELFAPLGNLDKLFFMDRAGHMLIAAKADAEREVRPNPLPGGYQQVLQEAEAVLQRAAVLIGALVGARR